MTDPNQIAELRGLAERVEKASGPDRELELAIYLQRNPNGDVAKMMARGTKGLDGCSRFAWELRDKAFLFEQRNERGDCTYNGGIPIPAYTASLDAAMTLVPEGCGWRLWVPDRRQRGDHDQPFVTIWGSGRSYAPSDTISTTPALALCAAALRARASLKDTTDDQ